MRVGTRLYLATAPGILGMLTVLALVYWGRYGRQVPALVVIVAIAASVASLALAWRNTRHVARRVERLARRGAPSAERRWSPEPRRDDELDVIQHEVEHLDRELQARSDAADRRVRDAESSAAGDRALLELALATVRTALQGVQLPVHILLSSPFGELNENQEELLGAAQQALDAADVELRRLGKLIEVERGAVAFRSHRIGVPELLRPPLAIAAARAATRQVQVDADVPDTLPCALVDPVYAEEALTTILLEAVGAAGAGEHVQVRAAEGAPRGLAITVRPGVRDATRDGDRLDLKLARRVLEAQGGALIVGAEQTEVALPSE